MTKKSVAVLDSNAENLEKRNLLFTVSAGRKANLLAEGSAEISRIVKTHLVSDICDAGTGVTQQHFSFLDAVAIQIFHWTETQLLQKDAAQIIFAHADSLGHLLARQTLGIILLQIRNRLFDQEAGWLWQPVIALQETIDASGSLIIRQNILALEHDLGMIQALEIFGRENLPTDHQDWHMTSPGVGSHLGQDRKAIDFWHDQIQNHQGRNFLAEYGQGG